MRNVVAYSRITCATRRIQPRSPRCGSCTVPLAYSPKPASSGVNSHVRFQVITTARENIKVEIMATTM